MLCSRSASLMRMTLTSSAMKSSILRYFSICSCSGLSKLIPLILVTPSMITAISSPNSLRISSRLWSVSSTISWSRPPAMVTESRCLSAKILAVSTQWSR